MALAAVLCVAIADLTAPARSLRMDGVDLLVPPSSGHFATRIETINLIEEGPGGVSSLSFTIEDPLAEMTLAEMAVVSFYDHTNNRPLFQGWMISFDVIPWASRGRTIKVECVGIESLLDWMLVPALTIPVNTTTVAAIQSCVANATGVGWGIRAFSTDTGSFFSHTSTQALPIGYNSVTTLSEDVVLDGTSLRESIAQVIAKSPPIQAFHAPGDGESAIVTIDYTSGLRVLPTYLVNDVMNVSAPADYGALTITDTPAGTYAASGLHFNIESGGGAVQVYVTGATPAASGLWSDGSGTIGQVAQINDSSITTTLAAELAASDYLFQFTTTVRGSFSLDALPSGFLASGNYRAGGTVTFGADGQIVLAAITFIIAAIHKSWRPGVESWEIDFGGFRPSAMKQIRRLTRSVRS